MWLWRLECNSRLTITQCTLVCRRTRTYIWDVTDLENPTLQNIHYHINNAIDHNQYVLGQYTYQSNYE